MKTNPEKLKTAAAIGATAFREGRARIPGQDPQLNTLLKSLVNSQVGDYIPYLKAWLNAWDQANMQDFPKTDAVKMVEPRRFIKYYGMRHTHTP